MQFVTSVNVCYPLHNFSCCDLHNVQVRTFERDIVQLGYKIMQVTLHCSNNEFVIKTTYFLT